MKSATRSSANSSIWRVRWIWSITNSIHHIGERGQVQCEASILIHGEQQHIEGFGNGPINAFVHALESIGLKDFKVTDYRSHAVRGGSDASAAAYVQVQHDDGRLLWGAGVDPVDRNGRPQGAGHRMESVTAVRSTKGGRRVRLCKTGTVPPIERLAPCKTGASLPHKEGGVSSASAKQGRVPAP